MRIVLWPMILALVATPALAQSRPSTTAMSCAAANALVMSSHAIVLSTGRDTFERFVSDRGQCQWGQDDVPAFAPTANNPQCMVGWRCVDLSKDFSK